MLRTFQFRRRNADLSAGRLLIWWTLVPIVVGTLFRLVWRTRVRGRRHIPATGPALVIANHQSHLDPMLLGCIISDRGPRMMARRSLYTDSPWPLPWILRVGYQVIFLDRGAADPAAMRAALTELQSGRVSIVFPEGTRTPDGHVQAFKRGVWLLIKRGGAPVLPIGIEGTFDAWPRGARPSRRGRIEVSIGEPVPAADLIAMGPDAALEWLRERIDAQREDASAGIRARSHGRWPGGRSERNTHEGESCTAGK